MKPIKSIQDIVTLLLHGETDWDKYGNVRVQQQDNLAIFSYTRQAAYGDWNYFERVARGLIINTNTGEIVARPFDKFFNWGEGERTTDAPLIDVLDKADGSLGILYRHQGVFRIATRGSFISEQAQWATQWLDQLDLTNFPDEITLLFEIIYPENQIVLDYHGYAGLILLGARNRHNGVAYGYPIVQRLAQRIGVPVITKYPVPTVDELLILTNSITTLEREGYVGVFADGQMFKFKTKPYTEIHGLINQLTTKKVWKIIANNSVETVKKIINSLPSHAGVKDVFILAMSAYEKELLNRAFEISIVYDKLVDTIGKDTDRKTAALWITTHYPHLAKYLFMALDNKNWVNVLKNNLVKSAPTENLFLTYQRFIPHDPTQRLQQAHKHIPRLSPHLS